MHSPSACRVLAGIQFSRRHIHNRLHGTDFTFARVIGLKPLSWAEKNTLIHLTNLISSLWFVLEKDCFYCLLSSESSFQTNGSEQRLNYVPEGIPFLKSSYQGMLYQQSIRCPVKYAVPSRCVREAGPLVWFNDAILSPNCREPTSGPKCNQADDRLLPF